MLATVIFLFSTSARVCMTKGERWLMPPAAIMWSISRPLLAKLSKILREPKAVAKTSARKMAGASLPRSRAKSAPLSSSLTSG